MREHLRKCTARLRCGFLLLLWSSVWSDQSVDAQQLTTVYQRQCNHDGTSCNYTAFPSGCVLFPPEDAVSVTCLPPLSMGDCLFRRTYAAPGDCGRSTANASAWSLVSPCSDYCWRDINGGVNGFLYSCGNTSWSDTECEDYVCCICLPPKPSPYGCDATGTVEHRVAPCPWLVAVQYFQLAPPCNVTQCDAEFNAQSRVQFRVSPAFFPPYDTITYSCEPFGD